MKCYAEQQGFFSREEIALLNNVRQIVEALPEIELIAADGKKKLVSCHLLAHAMSVFFPLTPEDGYFAAPGMCHSWLITVDGNILDVYPIAQAGGPVLYDRKFMSPWRQLFIEHELDNVYDEDFVRHLSQVRIAVQTTMRQLRMLPSIPEPFVWASRQGSASPHNAHLVADGGS